MGDVTKYTPENVLREDPYNMAGGIYDFIKDLKIGRAWCRERV